MSVPAEALKAEPGLQDDGVNTKLLLKFKGSLVKDLLQSGKRGAPGDGSSADPAKAASDAHPADKLGSALPSNQLEALSSAFDAAAGVQGDAGLPGQQVEATTVAAVVPQHIGNVVLVEPAKVSAPPTGQVADSRKRPAEVPAEGNLRPAPSAKAATTAGNGQESAARSSAPTLHRRVHNPGATARAVARVAAVNAAGSAGGGRSNSPGSAGGSGSTTPTAYTAPKRVPALGATQAAISRLANVSSVASAAQPAAAPGSGSRRVPAPGATQAAMARLAALNAGAIPPKTYSAPPINGAYHNASSGAAPAPHYAEGTVVWAKMQSYPWWPSQVQRPSPEQQRLKHGPTDVFVVFYGTADYTWLTTADVRPFRAEVPDYSKYAGVKNNKLQKAIDEAWVYIGRQRPDVLGKPRL